eukprot:7306469-Karenia_brevis.AAC.1
MAMRATKWGWGLEGPRVRAAGVRMDLVLQLHIISSFSDVLLLIFSDGLVQRKQGEIEMIASTF